MVEAKFTCAGKQPRVLRQRRHQSNVCAANVPLVKPLVVFHVVINLQARTQRVVLTLETCMCVLFLTPTMNF